MTIQIDRPEVEDLINQRLKSGAFVDAQDVILAALRASMPGSLNGQLRPPKDLVELFAPVRGLFADGELNFSRNPATSRD